MKIDNGHIQSIINKYEIHDEIIKSSPYIEYYNMEEPHEVKFISKIDLRRHKPIIIKITKEYDYSNQVIEEQSIFSQYMRTHGVLTPRRYKSGSRYCIEYEIDSIALNVTVEDYIGEELKAIDEALSFRIGALMGKMHKLSTDGDCHIHNNTIFDLNGYDEVNGFTALKELAEANKINCKLFDEINELYQMRIKRALENWSELPRHAVQGDISINNLSLQGDEIAIFDYNISGDEVLVGDMIIEGLLTAYEMDAPAYEPEDRFKLFLQFVRGYMSVRELTKGEIEAAGDICAVSDALWFTRIRYNDNSIEKLLEKDDQESINSVLIEIKDKLLSDYSEIFIITK